MAKDLFYSLFALCDMQPVETEAQDQVMKLVTYAP